MLTEGVGVVLNRVLVKEFIVGLNKLLNLKEHSLFNEISKITICCLKGVYLVQFYCSVILF